MKRIIEFEGWCDYEAPGWQFDMPVYMVKPCLMYIEAGNDGGVDILIEDYLISRWMEIDTSGKAIGTDTDLSYKVEDDDTYVTIHGCKTQFALAKKGKARKSIRYWRRVIEWDDEDENYERILEDNIS